jgi:hypothetical protein
MMIMGYDYLIFPPGDVCNPFFVFLCFSIAASAGERFVRRGYSFLARRMLMTTYLLVAGWVFANLAYSVALSLHSMALESEDWPTLAPEIGFVLERLLALMVLGLLLRLFWASCPEVAISNVHERGDRAVTVAGCASRAFFFAFFGMGFLTESIYAPIDHGTPLTWDAGHVIKLAVYMGCAMFVLRRYLRPREPHQGTVVLRSPLEGRGRHVATTIVGCWLELFVALFCIQMLFALPSVLRIPPVDGPVPRWEMNLATCQIIQNTALGILLLVLAAEDYILVRKLCRGEAEERVS